MDVGNYKPSGVLYPCGAFEVSVASAHITVTKAHSPLKRKGEHQAEGRETKSPKKFRK